MIIKINSRILAYFCINVFLGLLVSLGSVAPVFGEGVQRVGADEIKEISKQFLLDELAWNPERLEINVEYRGEALNLPKGPLDWDFNMPGRKKRIGRVPFQLTLKQNGRVLRQMRLQAQVQVTYNLFKATRPLKRGHILELNDVEITQVKSRKMLRNMVTDWDELAGHQLRRNVEEGQTLSTYMLKKVPLVKRGDRITLIAKRGSLKVTAPGVVRENGFKNQMVKVENAHSRKIVYGTVMDSKTIIVNF